MITYLIGILTGIINGLFGAGGGTIIVPAMQKYLKIETHKSHASAIAVILPLSIVSAFVYFSNMEIDIYAVCLLSVGGIIGGFIGAKLLNKITSNYLHKIFGIFMIIISIRMIFS